MTDIRTDPDVLRVYWEMKGVTEFEHTEKLCKLPDSDFAYRWMCSKCREDSDDIDTDPCPIPDPITLPLWELAGFMRDQCDKKIYLDMLCVVLKDMRCTSIAHATPEQVIEASVRSWGAK